MSLETVVYCTTCQMWFDTKNGWKALKASFGNGIPICPACTGLLMQMDADKFYERNRAEGRLDEVMTWEWPNGSLWKIKAGDAVIHKPTGEKWFLLGVNKKADRVCVAGWPPTEAKLSDCELHRKGLGIKPNELEYRNKTFGADWEE